MRNRIGGRGEGKLSAEVRYEERKRVLRLTISKSLRVLEFSYRFVDFLKGCGVEAPAHVDERCGAFAGLIVTVAGSNAAASCHTSKDATVCGETQRHRLKFFWCFGVMQGKNA
jgi:hypothetical protein